MKCIYCDLDAGDYDEHDACVEASIAETIRPLLLDLFCGAGGAAVGYWHAGFDVVGVDNVPQPHYPFPFYCADARTFPLDGYDAIHASPPCQAYSTATPDRAGHADLYAVTRARLAAHGQPWVIENVIGAPYRAGIVLCGSMFGLRVRRHRNFESSHALFAPPCDHRTQGRPLGVYGDGGPYAARKPGGGMGLKAARREWADLVGVPWATWREAAQAVPPAYTEYVGVQLLAQLTDHARE